MKFGLQELVRLATWASQNAYDLRVTPIRRYKKSGLEGEIVQTEQSKHEDWM